MSFHTRSRLNPKHNSANVLLFVDGKRILDWEQKNPTEISGDFSEPTWIGSDSQGKNTWTGMLMSPEIFNALLANDKNISFDSQKNAEQKACKSSAG